VSDKTCPTCGQPWPRTGPKRVCTGCALPIRRHDRWHFGRRGPEHNDCEHPEGLPLIEPEPTMELLGVSDGQ